MSESIQAKGKTVSEAVSEALLQLGLRRDEVEIKVLEEPKSGLLGFIGSRQAKVMVRKKPERERGRGRGRDQRQDDSAHSLSGGGRSRGGRSRSRGGRGRGRGGRSDQDNIENKNQQEGRQEGRQDNRQDQRQAGRQDNRQDNRPDNQQEGRQENRQENRQDSRQEGRQENRGGRGSRGGRGGRGGRRDQGQRRDNNEVRAEAGDSVRNDNRSERPVETREGGRGGSRGGRSRRNQPDRQDAPRVNTRSEDTRPDENLVASQEVKQEVKQEVRSESNPETRPETTQAPAPAEARSPRRSSRGGGLGGRRARVRDEQKQEPRAEEKVASSAQVANDIPVTDIAPETPNIEENTSMTREQINQPTPEAPKTETAAPAAAKAEAATPVDKPKRKGWGGGLGSRLGKKSNPAVKDKPKPVEIVEAAPAPAAPGRDSYQPREDRGGRSDYRDNRSASVVEEVIISGVAASRYAKAITDVNDDNLDTALTELTNGMLARAGFPCDVTVEQGEYRLVCVSSDDESAGLLIGRHGQTVDAVGHLVERMISNSVDDRVRMNLDINEYRKRREDSLAESVANAIAEVRETGKAYHVEPMSARERRLVHLEAEPVEGIRTFTMIGSGGKHVVIALDNEADDRDQNED